MSLRRIGMVGLILGILLVADGIYMVVSQYNSGETQAWNLPDGWIIIISAAVLLVASVIALVLPSRSRQTAVAPSRIKSEVGSEKG
jgi:drug/metabolite transporter (DMT)-like permease